MARSFAPAEEFVHSTAYSVARFLSSTVSSILTRKVINTVVFASTCDYIINNSTKMVTWSFVFKPIRRYGKEYVYR